MRALSSSPMAEIELKFEIPPESQAEVGKLAALRGTAPATARLHAIYFDTAGFDLRRHEMALRLRRTGRRWVQCLKAGRSGAGGLHAREEWEFDRPDATLDLSLFERLPALDRPLTEMFEVDVRRTTWRLEPTPGDRIEVALDRGTVRHQGRTEPVSEIEIESLGGDPAAIFAFAERLVGLLPLRPSATTKAARGYRLARGERRLPAKARAATLGGEMSTRAAAAAILGAALEQLQANDEGVLREEDCEYLHQLRVATRRMRSALRVFGPVLETHFVAASREDLRWLSQVTGPARDWDVLATQIFPLLVAACGESPALRTVGARIATRQGAARASVRAALSSPRYARLVMRMAQALDGESRAAPPDDAPGLAAFAARAIRKGHGKLLAGARRLSILTPAERHELRLEAKKVRYAAEDFAPLFRAKRVGRYLEILSDIQEDLGRANDAAVAARLLGEIKVPAAFAHFARGWLAAHAQSGVAGLERHGERLAQARPFWEKP